MLKAEKIARMKDLIKILNEASVSYHKYDTSIMTDKEFDEKYKELCDLEIELQVAMVGSPTQRMEGYLLETLPVVKHDKPMLSANKTKVVGDIKNFVSVHGSYCSWKLDGLTLVLTYMNGELFKAVTRGNGVFGEDVTEQAKFINNIPKTIPYDKKLVLRGETLISWNDFNRINEQIADENLKYKHPRNLAAGTIRQLNTSIVKERNLSFLVFECVTDFNNIYKIRDFDFISEMGFDVVPHKEISEFEDLEHLIEYFNPDNYEYPVDGLVFEYDNREYSKSLGATAKYENCRIALKWKDETAETTLRNIEWYTSRTGLVNPVAVFDPVEIEGAKISKASIYNVSVLKAFKLGIGDKIEVYRSNKVIPQIYANLTQSNSYEIPKFCPICGKPTKVCDSNGVLTLRCTNSYGCKSQLIDTLSYFASRDALDIKGLGESSIEQFVEIGILKNIEDIYLEGTWKKNKMSILNLRGWGTLAYENLLKSIESSKSTTLSRFLTGLGIPYVGKTACEKISEHCNGSIDKLLQLYDENFQWSEIDSIGVVMSASIEYYLRDNFDMIVRLSKMFSFDKYTKNTNINNNISDKVFVITGKLNRKSRKELSDYIINMNGKVSSSVTSKTDYLINNDINSDSSKNKDAKFLGVKIISENEFYDMVGVE